MSLKLKALVIFINLLGVAFNVFAGVLNLGVPDAIFPAAVSFVFAGVNGLIIMLFALDVVE